jgi:hypothetical protein
MSAELKSRLFLLYAMSLLDDSKQMPPSQEKSYDKILEEMTLAKLLNKTFKPVPTQQLTQPQTLFQKPLSQSSRKATITFKSAAAQRVFQSSPSFKDLLSEYNRFHGTRPPTKSTPGGTSAPHDVSDFRSDRVELIRLTHIPGKIIRPLKHRNPSC